MFRRLGIKVQAFARDRTGVVAIEFAMLSWLFFGIVLMIFNTLIVSYFRSSLDGAVQNLASDLRSGAFNLADAKQTAVLGGVTVSTVDVAILRRRLQTYFPTGMDANKVMIEVFTRSNCTTNGNCWDDAYSNPVKAFRRTPNFNENPTLSFLGATGSSSGSPAVQFGAAGDSQYLVVYYPMPALSMMFAKKDEVIEPPTVLAGPSDPPKRVFGLVSTAMWINDPSVGVF